MKERKGRPLGVYRLRMRGRSAAVIAKRCELADAAHERTIYESIIPRLPVTALQYYGFVSDLTDPVGWLFMEDAGDDRYSPEVPSHRTLASRWLGIMHSHGAEAASTLQLPDRGVRWYQARLQAARSLLEVALSGGTIGGANAARLRRISRWCEVTERRWPGLVEACEAIPSTLVHADFVGENVRVRREPHGLALLPFDWGTSGWAPPARDLVGIDIPTYCAAAKDRWPDVHQADLERATIVGRVFRRIAAVHRGCMSLPYWPVEKVISDMRYLAVRA